MSYLILLYTDQIVYIYTRYVPYIQKYSTTTGQ